jgi:hypothetical protein
MNRVWEIYVMFGQTWTAVFWFVAGWLWWGFGIVSKCLCGSWLSRWVTRDKPETGV